MIENFESAFLAFCKAKPAREVYDWSKPTLCAQGQFVISRNEEPAATGYYVGEVYIRYPSICHQAAVHPYLEKFADIDKAYTFGALVQRLEAAGIR